MAAATSTGVRKDTLNRTKGQRTPTLSTAESRALLQQYRADAASSNRERQRGAMSTTAGVKRQAANVATIVLTQYEAAMARKAYDEAVSCLLEAIRLGEARHDVFFNVAALMQHRGDLVEAVDYYTRAVQDDPLHGEDYLRRSECYAGLNQPLEAFNELEKYFKLEPTSKALLVKCGKFALDADLLDRAETYLTQALTSSSPTDDATEAAANDAYACFNLGELCERRCEDERAEEYFARVCQLDPGFPNPYLAQAAAEFDEGNFQMALHLYEAVAKITPTVPSVFLRLADVYDRLGPEFSGSVLASLTKAVELSVPSNAEYEPTLVRRGVLQYTVFDQLDDAVADFAACIEQNPENADARLHRATVLRKRAAHGDTLQAADDYRVAIALDIPWTAKAEPLRFLANFEVQDDNLRAAAHFYALAALWGPLNDVDTLNAVASFAAVQADSGTVFDDHYEARSYIVPKDDKARKAYDAALAARGPPLLPLAYPLIDRVYSAIRDAEPTMHTVEEHRVIAAWRPYRDEVERAREDDAAKSKKGAKKK